MSARERQIAGAMSKQTIWRNIKTTMKNLTNPMPSFGEAMSNDRLTHGADGPMRLRYIQAIALELEQEFMTDDAAPRPSGLPKMNRNERLRLCRRMVALSQGR